MEVSKVYSTSARELCVIHSHSRRVHNRLTYSARSPVTSLSKAGCAAYCGRQFTGKVLSSGQLGGGNPQMAAYSSPDAEGKSKDLRRWPRKSAQRRQPMVVRSECYDHQPYGIPDVKTPDRWDVVGLGQAMVDFSAMVGDGFLHELDLKKGVRKVVDHEERGEVLQALDGCSYKVSAGGSLSNTLVALARLGAGTSFGGLSNGGGVGKVAVAMTGSVGSDPLGDFYRTKLLRANVHFLSKPIVDGTTGTVVVLTTPDAQRTMLAYQGMSSVVKFDRGLENAISKSRMLVVEGYLWEIPKTVEAIAKACQAARSRGVLVALTASDVFCVLKHRQQFWDVMCGSTDVLFTNVDEARALAGFGPTTSPALVAWHLSRFCPLVSVTDGDRGAYLGLKGEVVYVPPSPCTAVDSCGAGDAYAAGVLYSLFAGVPNLESLGQFASKVASVVVSQQGARLREEDAQLLARSTPFRKGCLVEGSVFRRMAGIGNEAEVETEPSASI